MFFCADIAPLPKETKMQLAPGTWVVLSDGQKYLVLENKGDQDHISLETIAHETIDPNELSTSGLERAGRFKAFSDRRGAGDVANVRDIAEQRFVADLASKLDAWALKERYSALVVVADKTTLGTLRDRLTDHVNERIVAEIGRDIVHQTTPEIETLIDNA
jgi:protein required for attachment to host cells